MTAARYAGPIKTAYSAALFLPRADVAVPPDRDHRQQFLAALAAGLTRLLLTRAKAADLQGEFGPERQSRHASLSAAGAQYVLFMSASYWVDQGPVPSGVLRLRPKGSSGVPRRTFMRDSSLNGLSIHAPKGPFHSGGIRPVSTDWAVARLKVILGHVKRLCQLWHGWISQARDLVFVPCKTRSL